MEGIKKVIALALSVMFVALLLLSCSCQQSEIPLSVSVFDPLGNYDWQPQDYKDSQAIKAVELEEGRLVLDTHFVGGHSNYSKGEVFLDLRYVPGLEDKTPIDLTSHEIIAEVSVPEEFDGWESHPNGVQVFVKDADWKSQYGEWINIVRGGMYKVSLSPTTGENFSSTKIIIIGVKFAIGNGSLAKYEDPLC